MVEIRKQNPFKITTPEDLSAEETVKLFVDVFTDFYQITDPGHVLIKGPRGVGKSMMFRYLEPDCQCLANSLSMPQLPFIAIYVPLKNTNFALAELKQFEDKHAYVLLNEHIMITHCLVKVFENLKNNDLLDEEHCVKLRKFYKESFVPILELEIADGYAQYNSVQLFDLMLKQVNRVYRQFMKYIKDSSFQNKVEPYANALYDYNDYFVPLMAELSSALSDIQATFYLLLDDAHFLSEVQTRILNTWLATRTSRKVSLKVSTQYNYKTYYTINGSTIDTPHDYTELDVATIYTEGNRTVKSTYYRRIKDIVKKRLELMNISSSVEDFFPPDVEQEKKISEIENYYISRYDKGEGRGYNRTDDARRYARADYIKSLGGKSKSSHTYSYAGFDQLVNISSGVVRYFLQQAHSMYAKQQAFLSNDDNIESISPSIQNSVVREEANQALFNELESYSIEGHENAYPKEDIQKLSNLIQGLGGLFRTVLLSERSERRVFSIAISDEVSAEVLRILDIGIQLGYFHRSTIGRKNAGSIGRTRLYVLNRRLAPIWTLDPNGFAGYLFLKNKILEEAISNPIAMIKKFDLSKKQEDDSIQLTLFDIYPDMMMEGEVELYGGENDD